jgi:tetratricopeptide (TPR) repeat protein
VVSEIETDISLPQNLFQVPPDIELGESGTLATESKTDLRSDPDWVAAIAAKNSKNWEELLKRARAVTRKYPESFDGFFWLGFGYNELAFYADSMVIHERALQINPKSSSSWNNLAVAYESLSKLSEALAAYEKSVQINPNDGIAWGNLGNANARVGRHADALSAYQKGANLQPQSTRMWRGLAMAHIRLGNREKAREAVAELRKVDSVEAERLEKQIP